jgi:hypothetical protein
MMPLKEFEHGLEISFGSVPTALIMVTTMINVSAWQMESAHSFWVLSLHIVGGAHFLRWSQPARYSLQRPLPGYGK